MRISCDRKTESAAYLTAREGTLDRPRSSSAKVETVVRQPENP